MRTEHAGPGPRRSRQEAPPPEWTLLLRAINLHIEIVDIVRYCIEYTLDHAQIDWKPATRSARAIWGDLRWYLEKLLTQGGGAADVCLPACDGELTAFYAALMARARAACATLRDPATNRLSDPRAFDGLLRAADQATADRLAACPEGRCFFEEFEQYVALDAMTYPLEFVSDLEGKDRIRVLRVSPRDAQQGFAKRPAEGKLAGDKLGHFSGFFKRSWRSNDILWGRLDTVCELVHALLSEERLREITESNHLRARAKEFFCDPAVIRRCFTNPPEPIVSAIVAWAAALLHDDAEQRENALDAAARDKIVESLIELAQLDVLYECVPEVIRDAVAEQAEWNQYAVPEVLLPTSDKDILAAVRHLPFPGGATDEEKDLIVCRLLADRTHQNAKEVDRLWRLSNTSAEREREWLRTDANATLTNGDRIVGQAIRESFRGSKGPTGASFQPTRGFVDPVVASRAAQYFALASLDDLRDPGPVPSPAQSRMGRFFLTEYRVGSEALWDGVPWLVLLEIMAKAALVLRNCVLGALPEDRRESVRAHPLFRFGFDWPLRLVYQFARYSRENGGAIHKGKIVAVTYAVTALVVAFFGRNSLFTPDDARTTLFVPLVGLVLVPAAILYVAARRILRASEWRIGFELAAAIAATGAVMRYVGWLGATFGPESHRLVQGVAVFVVAGLVLGYWIGSPKRAA